MTISLGPIGEDLHDTIYDRRNDPEVWKWLRQVGPLDRTVFDAYWRYAPKDPTKRLLNAEGSDGGKAIGGFTSIDFINGRAEFSFLHLNGNTSFIRDAIVKLLQFGFYYLRLNLVYIEIFEESPLIPIYEALDFIKEGTRREFYFRNGFFIDAHLYSLKSSEL